MADYLAAHKGRQTMTKDEVAQVGRVLAILERRQRAAAERRKMGHWAIEVQLPLAPVATDEQTQSARMLSKYTNVFGI
jgi:hypothetical protein